MQIKKIIRSERRTISLQICDDATLIVKAPLRVKNNVINQVILKHHKWLERKKKEILSRDIKFIEKQFVNGEKYFYLGNLYPLKIVQNNEMEYPLILSNGYFYLQENIPDGKETFLGWYKEAARKKILQRVDWYSGKTGLQYNRVKISNAQKRWGSCTNMGNLSFSWRLIMAPLPVVDYVVIHELVHLIEKNHSKSFWDKVQFFMPDYKVQKNWLKKNGYLLNLQ